MSRSEIAAVLWVLTFAAPSAGDAPPSLKSQTTSAPADEQRPVPRNLAVTALRTVIPDANFKEMPFDDFVEWLERKTKATVIVRWKLLEAAGVRRDQPITLQLKSVTLGKIIELVLDQLERDDPNVRFAAKADDNTLTLSTVKDLFRKLVTRTYGVQELLITIPDFAGGKAQPNPGQLSTGLTVIRPKENGKDPKTEEKARQLIEQITTHIQPESWKANGGKGTIVYFKGRLIIRNILLVHQQLGGGSPQSLGRP